MFRRFFRGIRDGFRGLRTHFAMAFSAMTTVNLTLLFAGVFLIFAFNLVMLTDTIDDSLSLSVLLNYDISEPSQRVTLKKNIEKLEGVEKVEFRSKDQELTFYSEKYPELISSEEDYKEDNPFHDVFLVYVSDTSFISSIRKSAEKFNEVFAVYDGGDQTYTLVRILDSVRIGGYVLTGATFFLAVYLIYNTIKISIASRKNEIWIMRNVGARNSYIRAPFLFEGFFIGLIGSLLPIGLILYFY